MPAYLYLDRIMHFQVFHFANKSCREKGAYLILIGYYFFEIETKCTIEYGGICKKLYFIDYLLGISSKANEAKKQ